MDVIKLEVQISQELEGLLMIIGVPPKEVLQKISTDLSSSMEDEVQPTQAFYEYMAEVISNCEGFKGSTVDRFLTEIKRQVNETKLIPLDISEVLEKRRKEKYCESCGHCKH